MAYELRDHPEIALVERTGYPSWKQPTGKRKYCCYCGDDITDDDQYEDQHYIILCKDCLLDLHKKTRFMCN